MTRVGRISARFAFFIVLAIHLHAPSTATAQLPRPSEDKRDGRMRFVSWQPPLKIPWFTVDDAPPLPQEQRPQRWYLERAARIRELVASPQFRSFIGARDGFDDLVPDRFHPLDQHPRLRQDYFVGDETAHLYEGAVTLHLTDDGTAIQGITSAFRVEFSPKPPVVTAKQATEIVAKRIRELGLPTTVPSGLTFLIGRREPVAGAYLKPRDRLFRRFLFWDPRAPSFRSVEVMVDAADGSIYSLQPHGADVDMTRWGTDYIFMPGDPRAPKVQQPSGATPTFPILVLFGSALACIYRRLVRRFSVRMRFAA